MRPMKDLFKELGFNKDAPLGTQKAFFKHLVQHAETVRMENLRATAEVDESQKQSVTETSTQLSFDPKILGLIAK